MKICAVIPAFNEGDTIEDIVAAVLPRVDGVWVIDDGSEDETAARASSAGARVILMGKNRGKGAALRRGFAEIAAEDCDRVIILDGDGQHDPAEIPRLLQAADETGADIVVGNRMRDAGKMPPLRRLTNRFMSGIISFLAGQNVPDSQCGFRLLKAGIAGRLGLKTGNYDTESEMLITAGKMGLRIASVPVSAIYSGQQSRIRPVRDTLRFFRLVFRHLPGRMFPGSQNEG